MNDTLRGKLQKLADGYAESNARFTGLEIANHLTELLAEPDLDFEKLADEAERGYDVATIIERRRPQ